MQERRLQVEEASQRWRKLYTQGHSCWEESNKSHNNSINPSPNILVGLSPFQWLPALQISSCTSKVPMLTSFLGDDQLHVGFHSWFLCAETCRSFSTCSTLTLQYIPSNSTVLDGLFMESTETMFNMWCTICDSCGSLGYMWNLIKSTLVPSVWATITLSPGQVMWPFPGSPVTRNKDYILVS